MPAPKSDQMSDMAPPRSIDIAKAGAQAPPATSKPVIVTNKPQVADPTLTSAEPEKNGTSIITGHNTTVIKPPEGTEERIAAENESTSGNDPDEAPQSKAAAASTNDANEMDAVAEGTVKKSKKQEQEDDKQQLAFQKVIESKKYFLKINESPNQTSIGKLLITLLLAILILLILLNFLIDAQVVDIGLKSVTDIL